jgi:hypothetical protein
LGVDGECPDKFGIQCTGDHLINRRKDNFVAQLYEEDSEFPSATTAVVFYDRGSKWHACYPKATKTTEDTVEAMQSFQGDNPIHSFYSDNSKELSAAAKYMHWKHPTATPGVPQTNGLGERAVRTVKEGGRCELIQAGLHASFWEDACPCFWFKKNTEGGQDSAYFKRHGVESNHLRIPFGTLVDFMPTPQPDNHDIGPFESKTIPGIFLGYHEQPGGKWSGDYWVAEFEPFRSDPDRLYQSSGS